MNEPGHSGSQVARENRSIGASTSAPSSSQLVDVLVAHVGVYDRATTLKNGIVGASRDRELAQKWFCSLSSRDRQRVLTVQDSGWVRLLVSMSVTRRTNGQGHFYVDTLLKEKVVLPSSSLKSSHRASGSSGKPGPGKKGAHQKKTNNSKTTSGQVLQIPAVSFRRVTGLLQRCVHLFVTLSKRQSPITVFPSSDCTRPTALHPTALDIQTSLNVESSAWRAKRCLLKRLQSGKPIRR
eukprot:436087-Pyramimonas_sp.AAC.1